MTLLDAARVVVETKTAHLVRRRQMMRLENGATVLQVAYDAKPIDLHGRRRGWVLLDLYTASAIVAAAARLSEQQRRQLETLPVGAAASICLRLTWGHHGRRVE